MLLTSLGKNRPTAQQQCSHTLRELKQPLTKFAAGYNLPVWASTHKTLLTKLQRLQNKALRIISKTRNKDSISQQNYKFKVLKIEDLFTFEIAKIVHQFTHKKQRIILYIFFLHNEYFISSYSLNFQQ